MPTSKNIQCNKVIDYCRRHGSITTYEAIINLGILSLSRRICDIRSLGYIIEKRREMLINAAGKHIHIIRYFIKEKAIA